MSSPRSPQQSLSSLACQAFADQGYEVTNDSRLGVVAEPSSNTTRHRSLPDSFRGDPLSISVGHEFLRPSTLIGLLSDAVNTGHKCVIIVPDGRPDNRREFYAEIVQRVFTDPPFYSQLKEGERVLYTGGRKLKTSNGDYVLTHNPTPVTSNWVECDGEVSLSAGREDLSLPTSEVQSKPRPSRIPSHYRYDIDSERFVVRDSESEILGEYESRKEMQRDGWWTVYEPLIPEHEFFDTLPDDSQWTCLLYDREATQFLDYSASKKTT